MELELDEGGEDGRLIDRLVRFQEYRIETQGLIRFGTLDRTQRSAALGRTPIAGCRLPNRPIGRAHPSAKRAKTKAR